MRACLWALCLLIFPFIFHSFALHHPTIRYLSLRPSRWLLSQTHFPPHLFLPQSIHPLSPPSSLILHFSSKPSRMRVCFRAVSSTNLASTFSCSSNGFRARTQEARDIQLLLEDITPQTSNTHFLPCTFTMEHFDHARTWNAHRIHTFGLNPPKASVSKPGRIYTDTLPCSSISESIFAR